MSVQEQQPSEQSSTQELIDELILLKATLRQSELREPKIFVTDVTPEAMESALAEQKERIGLLTDEGNLFDILSGMYSNGKQNLDVFLKGHSGGPLRVKRQGRVHDLSKIALSIGLAIQPGVLRGIADKDGRKFREKGLLARFLPYIPKSNIGTREIRVRTAVPDEVKTQYHRGIKALLNIQPVIDEYGVETPRTITLSAEALTNWLIFSQQIEDQQGEGREFESLQDFTGKLPGQALRIAAVCHIAGMVDPNTLSSMSSLSIENKHLKPIDHQRLIAVQDMCKQLVIHAGSMFNLMGDNAAISDAKYCLGWILANSIQDSENTPVEAVITRKNRQNPAWLFRQNALHKSPRFKNSKLDRVLEALKILEQRHIISKQFKLPTKKPTYVYWVNPDVLALRERSKSQ